MKPGIWPINTMVFTHEEFDGAFVTDRPNPTNVENISAVMTDRSGQYRTSEAQPGTSIIGCKSKRYSYKSY